MTKERAIEILNSINASSGWRADCTPEERKEITKVWDKMPGWTCFTDAVTRIAYPELWKKWGGD